VPHEFSFNLFALLFEALGVALTCAFAMTNSLTYLDHSTGNSDLMDILCIDQHKLFLVEKLTKRWTE